MKKHFYYLGFQDAFWLFGYALNLSKHDKVMEEWLWVEAKSFLNTFCGGFKSEYFYRKFVIRILRNPIFCLEDELEWLKSIYKVQKKESVSIEEIIELEYVTRLLSNKENLQIFKTQNSFESVIKQIEEYLNEVKKNGKNISSNQSKL